MKNNELAECSVFVDGVFCDCGGLMDMDGEYLMSNPPKQPVKCQFCDKTDYVDAPYIVQLHFKKIKYN